MNNFDLITKQLESIAKEQYKKMELLLQNFKVISGNTKDLLEETPISEKNDGRRKAKSIILKPIAHYRAVVWAMLDSLEKLRKNIEELEEGCNECTRQGWCEDYEKCPLHVEYHDGNCIVNDILDRFKRAGFTVEEMLNVEEELRVRESYISAKYIEMVQK